MVWFPFADIGYSGGAETVDRLVELIREKKPDIVLSHWPGSWHSGHSHSANCTLHAVEVSPYKNPRFKGEPHRVKAVYCPENWEDPFNFVPSLYVDVSDVMEVWERSCRAHELFTGGASSFRYLDYYKGAMQAHGAVVKCQYAVAVATPPAFDPRKVKTLPA